MQLSVLNSSFISQSFDWIMEVLNKDINLSSVSIFLYYMNTFMWSAAATRLFVLSGKKKESVEVFLRKSHTCQTNSHDIIHFLTLLFPREVWLNVLRTIKPIERRSYGNVVCVLASLSSFSVPTFVIIISKAAAAALCVSVKLWRNFSARE